MSTGNSRRESTAGAAESVKVLMVCLGNICRSPTAHGVMLSKIEEAGLEDRIVVDSAGTGDWHIGAHPDPRATAAAQIRGYEIAELIARQVALDDFQTFDYILCMDRNNLKALRDICPGHLKSRLRLFLDFADSGHETVPDPYYSGAQGFELVLDLVEDACTGLLNHIRREHLS